MKLHPRTGLVNEAGAKIQRAISQAAIEYGLTSIELLQILQAPIQTELRHMLRAERHPENPSKRSDEA